MGWLGRSPVPAIEQAPAPVPFYKQGRVLGILGAVTILGLV